MQLEQTLQKTECEECLANFKQRLTLVSYSLNNNCIERSLSEVNFELAQLALKEKQKRKERLLPLVTTYHPKRVANLNLKCYLNSVRKSSALHDGNVIYPIS